MGPERTSRGSHGRKGCVIRVPDEDTSAAKGRTNERTTWTRGTAIRRGIATRTLMQSIWHKLRDEGRKTTTTTRRDGGGGDALFPKLVVVRIFSFTARELGRLARDRPLSPPADSSACDVFLPSFLPFSLFFFLSPLIPCVS